MATDKLKPGERPDGYLIAVQDHIFQWCPACASQQPIFILVEQTGTTMGCCKCQRIIRQIALKG